MFYPNVEERVAVGVVIGIPPCRAVPYSEIQEPVYQCLRRAGAASCVLRVIDRQYSQSGVRFLSEPEPVFRNRSDAAPSLTQLCTFFCSSRIVLRPSRPRCR